MIRLIVDKLGSGHKDLFLKIDAMPEHLQIADSYFIFDFLEIINEESKKSNSQSSYALNYGIIEFLNYWKIRIKGTINGQKTFLPFDLSDQYIGGLMIEKRKLGFKVKVVYTNKIQGFAIDKSSLDNEIKKNNIEFINSLDNEWLISEESFLNGLDWSINELE
jgi:hypothetical protein